MKNIIKTTAYSAVALSSVAFTFANDKYGLNDAKKLGWNANDQDMKVTIVNVMNYILTFLWLIAIIFAIYWGFQILTAGWDDDKVKKGKTTLINALIWIFVIISAWTIVGWIFGAANEAVTSTGG